ncbi:MAG: DUF1080 domain-containing protein [Ferruginibacter sp.]|nr:DUF1080 domain-containing protein [Chitinophagaceae bacterium]
MNIIKRSLQAFPFLLIVLYTGAQPKRGDPTLTETWSPVPKKITPGKTAADPPSDAIILYNSPKDTINWLSKTNQPFNWKTDGSSFTVVPGSGEIHSRKSFGDCQLHIEWRTPLIVKGEGQGRGNSGIFLMSLYELQVLDSYNNSTYSNGQAGSIYKQHIPMANVSRPPGEWQTYDILFTAPQFYPDSSLKSAARITVFQNGVLVQNNVELWGPTEYIGVPKYKMHAPREPLMLQDHGDLLSFRNIWIREL